MEIHGAVHAPFLCNRSRDLTEPKRGGVQVPSRLSSSMRLLAPAFRNRL